MMTSLEKDILKTLAYYDIFNYPLREDEIYLFLEKPVSRQQLRNEIDLLCRENMLFNIGGYYMLRNDPSLKERRLEGNRRATRLLKRAYRICRFLFHFPFVRGIAISGSLSKNFANNKSDIDYFIITSANRLWIARTFLHLFKKLTFLVGMQHRYCMNYFIDEECEEIEERNIFTAIELVTLLPVCGHTCMDGFYTSNGWALSRFPNHPVKNIYFTDPFDRTWLKKTVESLFNNKLGERIDNYLMKLTARRWSDKEQKQKLNMKGDRMGLKTGKHYAKPNPVFFQQKVLSLYAGKLSEIEKRMLLSPHIEPGILFEQARVLINSGSLQAGSFPPHFTPREPGL
jgi:hypothetical protein